MSRVKGHALRREGHPYLVDERGDTVIFHGWTGRGLCECGALSPIVGTDGARKQWHREHKAEVLA